VTLADLRKVSIRKNVRIRFRTGGGLDCVIDEHGIAQVPGLTGPPDFGLEQELSQAQEFVMEPAAAGKQRIPERLNRQQLAALTSPGGAGGEAHGEADE
jgi:hypothetical protein